LSQSRKQRHRTSTPPPHPRASFHRSTLVPGLQTIDGIPVLRLDREAFAALDRRSTLLIADLDGATDLDHDLETTP
jgi:hypothetical protein